VDDGSTDNSGKLCDEYKRLDKRIKAYHKENGGLSDARNYGIEKAKGKYICFVDSDDYVTSDMCEILYNDIISTNADVAMCNLVDCYGIICKIDNSNIERCVFSPEEAIREVMLGEKVRISVNAKLYRKNLFDKIEFEKGKTYEDAIIMVELLDKCEKISYNSSKVYYYIHRENSITTQRFSEKCYDVIYAYEKNRDIIMSKYPKIIYIADIRLCWARFVILERMAMSDATFDDNAIRYLKKRFLSIMRSRCLFGNLKKISLVILLLSKRMYRKVVKYYYRKKRSLVAN